MSGPKEEESSGITLRQKAEKCKIWDFLGGGGVGPGRVPGFLTETVDRFKEESL